MTEVEYFAFMLPPSRWSKKPYASQHKMTVAYAAEHHPGATPILSTRELRAPSEPITADSPYCRLLRAKTAEEEAHHQWLISRIGAKGEKLD